MNFSDFTSDPPAKIAQSATNVEEIEETYQAVGFDIDCRQTMGGSFHCRTATSRIGEIGAIWQRCDKSVFIQAEVPPGYVHFTIPISLGGPGIFKGESYTDRELMFYQPGADFDLSGSGLTGGDVLVLPENRFHEIAEALFPETIALEQNATRMIQRDRESIDRVRRLIQNLIADPTTHQDTEQISALIAEIISWIADSGDPRAGERLIGNQTRGLIARRTRDFLNDKYRHPIPMEEICRGLGVSLRTLHRSFREYFDITPMQYLKILRLDNARRDLLVGNASVDSVTEIALNSGCAHLGRFSVEYRAHFGESPNETLALSAR
jgi:AraC-like DNA-binding protein